VQDKNREISPLGREEGYGGKDLEKRWVLRREWKTPWDTPQWITELTAVQCQCIVNNRQTDRQTDSQTDSQHWNK